MENQLDKWILEQITPLEKVVSDYNEFCKIAKQLEWDEIYEEHYDWSNEYPLGLTVDFYTFSKRFIRENLAKAYVRAVLASMAFWEEWGKDFWNIDVEERKICLTKGRLLYESYANKKQFRFKKVTFEYLKEEIYYYGNYNKVESVHLQQCIERIEGAYIIELGGCYGGDYTYLAIKDDSLMMVECGVWD